MFNLTAKLGVINEIEHITRVAKYILKISYFRLYHSDMGHCVSFSKKKVFFFPFLNWENRHGIGKNVAIFYWEFPGAEIRPLEKGRKSP